MRSPASEKPVASSFSMTGVLALLSGAAVFFFVWKFGRGNHEFRGSARIVLILTAVILILWGSRQIFGDLIPGFKSRSDADSAGSEPRIRISWMGLFLMFWGLQLFFLQRGFSNTAMKLFVVGLGVLLEFWGIREVASRLANAARVQRATRRVALPPSGLAYLVIMIVLFLGSQLGQSNMLMLVFSLMAGPFIINGAVIVIMLERLSVRRIAPESAFVGEPIAVELVLRNDKSFFASSLMAVTDTLANDRERLPTGVLITRVPAKDERSARYQVLLMQRGRYQLGPVYVGSRFPLGIVERGLVFDLPGEILVAPRLGWLTPRWRREHGLADELMHRPNTKAGMYEDEFHRIREYRPGDNPRLIHWRSSAKQSQLMVREFHQSRNQSLIVLLDLFEPDSPTFDEEHRVELAVSFAATICLDQMRQSRDSSLFVASAGETLLEWSVKTGPASQESLMKFFAIVEAGPDPPMDQAVSFAVRERGIGTRIVIISTRPRFNGRLPHLDDLKSAAELGKDVTVFAADIKELEPYFYLPN
jgi:uncharacterized protein (DUF58 family)